MNDVHTDVDVERIARACHEVNRAYCASLGDASQAAWENAPDWQKESARNGVRAILHDPAGATPGGSHRNWLEEKIQAGWTYGPIKDPAKRQHPCMVPFNELPREQQTKDFLFLALVKALI